MSNRHSNPHSSLMFNQQLHHHHLHHHHLHPVQPLL
jgi:hypothetical protein